MKCEIKIDKEFKNLIPPLTSEEYKQLESNIIAEGCRDTLVVWNDTLIDGHNRYEICTKNDMLFNIVSKEFKNREEVIEWIIRNQFGRRNLPNYERGKLALRLESVISDRAKENQQATQLIGKGIQNKNMVNQKSDEPLKPVNTSRELAKIAGVSHDTIEKIKVIEREATVEQKEELTKGTKTVNKVYREIKPKKEKLIEETITEVVETKKCDTCGTHKPISEFTNALNTCNICRNFINKSAGDSKTIKEKLKQFAGVDVEAMYEEMKQPNVKKEENNEIENEYITSFNQLLNKFDTEINQYTHMNFIFKEDSSLKPLVEKQILNLKKIIEMMGE